VLTGRRVRLTEKILAIDASHPKLALIQLRAGVIVEIVEPPEPWDRRMVGVAWDGSVFLVFEVDLEARSEDVGHLTMGA